MKILVVTGRFGGNYPGGIERVAFEVCKRLSGKHELMVLAHKRISDDTADTKIPIKTIPSFNIPKTNFWVFFYIIKKRRAIKKLVEKFRPDIIYSHNPYDAYASLDFEIPVVCHIHSLYTEHFMRQESSRTILPRIYWNWFWKFRLKIEKVALSKSNLVITYSEYLSNLAKERGAKNVEVIPNGIDTSAFSPKGNKSAQIRRPAVLFVGRIEKIKGIQYLADAAKSLPQVNFFLIGEKKDNFEFPSNVYLLGQKNPSEIPSLLKSADIFLNPVTRDGFEIVNIEAMACGIPVITTDSYERSNIYKNVAILVKPQSTEEIVQSILRLLKDESLRSNLAEGGIKFALQYDWDNIVSKIERKLLQVSSTVSHNQKM